MFQIVVSLSQKKKCKVQFLILDGESISLLGKELLEKLKVLRIGLPQVASVRRGGGGSNIRIESAEAFFFHGFGET